MQKIKVGYVKGWADDGSVYKQQITISKDLVVKFNRYVADFREANFKDERYNSLYDNEYMYLKEIDVSKNFYYTKLTQAKHLDTFLSNKGIDTKRFLHDRNTMLILK